MDKCLRQVLHLINNAIMYKDSTLAVLNEEEWDEVYQILNHNAMFVLVFKYVMERNNKLKIPPNLLEKWKTEAFAKSLYELRRRQELKQIILDARKENIEFVIFKGIVLQNMYEDKNARIASDVDLLIPEEERDRIFTFFKEKGYEWIKQKDNVDVAQKDGLIVIELHSRLWEDLVGSRIKIFEEYGFDHKDQLLQFEIDGILIHTLNYTQHFIYQLYHIAKHFSFEGIGLKYLVDIAMFYNLYHDKINHVLLWEILEKARMKEFALRVFCLTIEYFSMNKEVLAGYRFHLNQTQLEELLNLYIREGSNTKGNRWDIVGVLKPYFCDTAYLETNFLKRYRKMLLPDAKQMEIQYPYVKKYKYLIILAWMQRSVVFLKRRNKEKLSVPDKLRLADKQLEKMKKMKLIK